MRGCCSCGRDLCVGTHNARDAGVRMALKAARETEREGESASDARAAVINDNRVSNRVEEEREGPSTINYSVKHIGIVD